MVKKIKFKFGLIVLLMLNASCGDINPYQEMNGDRFVAIFMPNCKLTDFSRVDNVFVRQIGGYWVAAKITCVSDDTTRMVIQNSVEGHIDRYEEGITGLSSGHNTKLLEDRRYDDLRQKKWWDLNPSNSSLFYQKGHNRLSHDYGHWWFVDNTRSNVVFLIGYGL